MLSGGAEESKEDEDEDEKMDITLHPDDMKYFDKLPKLKVKIADSEYNFSVGYSNILYTSKDDKPYGMILSPPIQGRSVEIYVFKYTK